MNKRTVSINYRADDGSPISYSGELLDDDIARLIKMLDGDTFEDLFMEQVEKEEWHR